MSDIRIVHAFVEGEEHELIETLEARITDLERERDEARQEIDAWIAKWTDTARERNELIERVKRLERDLHQATDANLAASCDLYAEGYKMGRKCYDELLAENRLLRATLHHCATHAGSPSPCKDCLAAECGPIGGCKIQDGDADFVPLTAAYVERVKLWEDVGKAYREEWKWPGPECTCDEAYRSRSRDDPSCMYHQSPLVWDALRAALAEEGDE